MVSFAAGGPTDQVARVMSAKLTELLGQTFIVENRTGAGGNRGAADVAKAAPDGYTLLMATVSTHAINPGLYRKMPYDPMQDFSPVRQVGVTPCVLAINTSLPVTDVKGLIALLEDPAVLKRLQDAGVDPAPGSTPEKLAGFIKAELAKWAPIIRASGAQVD
jgi:tripartite-type tricarboxylate transporter receptor subunit TctC